MISASLKRNNEITIFKYTLEHEFTPEYWASFLSIQGSRKLQIEEVKAQIIKPCIEIHFTYILLVCIYVVMTIIGCICWYIVQKENFDILTSAVDFASLACKESNIDSDKTTKIITKQARLEDISNNIKIFPRKESAESTTDLTP